MGQADQPDELPSTLRPFVLRQIPETVFDPVYGAQPYPQATWPLANPFPIPGVGASPYEAYPSGAYPSELPPSSQTYAPLGGVVPDTVPCDPTPTNLWGLESQRFFRSNLCRSPQGNWVAYTEMTFIPALRQTSATLYLSPVLPDPTPRAAPPRPRTWWERHLWDKLEPHVYPELYPPPPPVDHAERNQNPSYARQRAIPLLKLTFQPPFEFSTLQVDAWSADGSQLWVSQRTGKLHIGWQTRRRWHLDLTRQTIQSSGHLAP